MAAIETLESIRVETQKQLDSEKTRADRNKHGQFATPSKLASDILLSEFMDVNYGKEVKQYLLEQVTLLRIHRFDANQLQFDDALVSSTVVWLKNEKPPTDHFVNFTFGGSLERPAIAKFVSTTALRQSSKWTKFPSTTTIKVHDENGLKLSDLFEIKRGLATGANNFFILAPEQIAEHNIPSEFLLPILPSPRFLNMDEIEADRDGNPVLDRKLFLLSCNLPESQVKKDFPSLWKYFEMGVRKKVNERYISKHRTPWYAQENRPPCPLLCTYIGRQSTEDAKPFRFILNHSNATAANVYLLLYPSPPLKEMIRERPDLLRMIWQSLNNIPAQALIGEGRVYGGGLHKMEPRELANAPAESVLNSLPELSLNLPEYQVDLFAHF